MSAQLPSTVAYSRVLDAMCVILTLADPREFDGRSFLIGPVDERVEVLREIIVMMIVMMMTKAVWFWVPRCFLLLRRPTGD